MQPVLVQRPEVGDPRDEDVADGVELDVADLLHLARGADDFERPPLAPVPEVELVVSGNDEELGEKKGYYYLFIGGVQGDSSALRPGLG